MKPNKGKDRTMRAAIYARTAVKDDSKMEEQILACKKYASEKNWKITDIYMDSGMAGTDFSREALRSVLEDAAMGKIDILLTPGIDRLSRSSDDLVKIGRALRSAGVTLATLDLGLWTQATDKLH